MASRLGCDFQEKSSMNLTITINNLLTKTSLQYIRKLAYDLLRCNFSIAPCITTPEDLTESWVEDRHQSTKQKVRFPVKRDPHYHNFATAFQLCIDHEWVAIFKTAVENVF